MQAAPVSSARPNSGFLLRLYFTLPATSFLLPGIPSAVSGSTLRPTQTKAAPLKAQTKRPLASCPPPPHLSSQHSFSTSAKHITLLCPFLPASYLCECPSTLPVAHIHCILRDAASLLWPFLGSASFLICH